MYNKKISISCILLLVILNLVWVNPLFAVTTTQIDAVRNKEAIAESDITIIEDFINEAFNELLNKSDFSDIGALRNTIVSRSVASTSSGKILYDSKFLTAFQPKFSDALQKVSAITDINRKNILTTNLLILAYDMGKIEISKSALNYLQDENVMTRYWAANNFSSNALITALNAGSESDRKEIAGKILKAVQNEKLSDILTIYAQFASAIKDNAGNNILTSIAQKRIDLYLAWNVQDEMSEDTILKAMAERIKTDTDSTKIMGRYFSSLFSVVVQRYIQGQGTLKDTDKNELVTVIIQGDKYVQNFIPDWNGNFKRALDKDLSSLLAESNGLFGSAAGSGKMLTTLGFDYGKNPDGSAKTIPPTLAKPTALNK
ncbi:MAG: hypothetical protein ABFD79_06140 [Phycisphaerales bacterium]